jgi:hypothetical protein
MEGADTYLYDLNHFTLVEEAEEKEGARADRCGDCGQDAIEP